MPALKQTPKLDRIDLRILTEIQRNGRISKVALADKVGLSATPCWTRLRRLEDSGIISGYHARLAPRTVVPFASVLVEVTLANHTQPDFERFERVIRGIDEVVGCWAVGGGIDYMLQVVARDIDTYQRLIDSLLEREIGIGRYFSYVVTKTVKDPVVLPTEALLSGAVEDDG